jgi:arylamine N-acetyltransferase
MGRPSAAALVALHRAHVERVPYETVDIHLGRPTTTDPHEAVTRVLAGRGGTCFHLNGALGVLLNEPAAWFAVLAHRFGLAMDDASPAERTALWQRVHAAHQQWTATDQTQAPRLPAPRTPAPRISAG